MIQTIQTVDLPAGKKVGFITFEKDPAKKVKFWATAAFAGNLKAGATAEASFRLEAGKPKPDGSGNYPDETFLASWDGVEEKAKKGFGGGGRPSKSPEEILAEQKNIHASVALQTAREFVCSLGDNQLKHANQITEIGGQFYTAMRQWVSQ